MPVFRIKAPNGQTLDVRGETPPSEDDLDQIFKAAGVDTTAPADTSSAGSWENRGIGGMVWHPASGAKEQNRVDNALMNVKGYPLINSIVGMPPELAAIAGAKAIGPGLTLLQRAKAGLAGAAVQATPQIKYQVTKSALEGIGVPTIIAMPVAMAVSSYRMAPGTAPMSEEEAIAKAKELYPNANWDKLGSLDTPAPVEAEALTTRPVVQAAAQAATPIKLTASEMVEGAKWLKQGLSPAAILERIQTQREFLSKFPGLPTVSDVTKAVTDRNAAGYWPEGMPGR